MRMIITTFKKVPRWWKFEHHGLTYTREPQACAFTNREAMRGHEGPMWNATLRTPSFKDQRRFYFYPNALVTIQVPN